MYMLCVEHTVYINWIFFSEIFSSYIRKKYLRLAVKVTCQSWWPLLELQNPRGWRRDLPTEIWPPTDTCVCHGSTPITYTPIKKHNFRKLFKGFHIYCLYVERELVSALMVGCCPYCLYCSYVFHVPDHGIQQGHSCLSDFGFPSLL